MSNYFHPGVTRHMAEDLVRKVVSSEQARYLFDERGLVEDGAASIAELSLNRHACSAAGIMGNDPSSIYQSVWYRSDGWGHGGSAITWQERAEELEAELVTKNALIDRAKPLLEEYFSELDCSGETSSRAANEITKLLTDIEHL